MQPFSQKKTIWGSLLFYILLRGTLLLASDYYAETGSLLHRAYSADEHGGKNQTNQFASDSFGNVYMASKGGLIKYDGESWSSMPENGNPDFTNGVAVDEHQNIWACGLHHVGYYKADSSGNYHYVDLTESLTALEERDRLGMFWRLHSFSNNMFLITDLFVLRWNGEQWDHWGFETERRILPSFFENGFYVHSRGQGLYKFNGTGFDLLSTDESKCASGIIRIYNKREDGLLLCATVSDGLVAFDGTTFVERTTGIDSKLHGLITFDAIALPGSGVALATNTGLICLDQSGQLKSVTEPSAEPQLWALFYDTYYNLWAGGPGHVIQIPHLALSSFETEVVEHIERHDEQLYISTRREIHRLESRKPGQLLSHWEEIEKAEGSSKLESINGELFYGGFEKIGVLKNGRIQQKLDHSRYVFAFEPSSQSEDVIHISDGNAISRLRRVQGSWQIVHSITDRPKYYTSKVELPDGNLLATSDQSAVTHITWPIDQDTSPVVILWQEEHGLPRTLSWSYVINYKDHISLITSNGIYNYDADKQRFIFDSVLGNSLGNDSFGFEWASLADAKGWVISLPEKEGQSNSDRVGALYILEDGKLRWDPWQLPALNKVGSVESLFHEIEGDKEILWVGGSKSLFRYNLNELILPEPLKTRLSSVNEVTSKTTLFGGGGSYPAQNIWEYPQSNLHFEFAASPHPLERKSYESRLLGFEEKWLSTEDRNFRNYTNLPEGKYTFEGRAIDELGRTGPIESFHFEILAPWYRIWPVYLGYAILSSCLIYLSFRWWSMRLRQRNVDLESMVNQRTVELELQNVELQEANTVKQEFLASMSHEIRNPLNGILGIARLMHEDKTTQLTPTPRVDHLYACANHLHQLLGEVLDYSSLESGKLTPHPVPFNALSLCKEVLSIHREQATGKGLELKLTLPHIEREWIGDPTLIRQILINLVSNAVKYTAEGWVRLELLTHVSEGRGTACFKVQDTGPGIPDDKREAIFEKFTRLAKAGKSNVSGTGLGLAIASEIAHLLDGTLELNSKIDHGACFILQIPFEVGGPLGPETAPLSDKHKLMRGRRVLIADDMDFNRFINREVLERMGANVVEARNGREALDELHNGAFDLAILDINMPELSGLEVVSNCLADARMHPPVFVALSAHITPKVEASCLAAGFDHFLDKPLEPEKLQSVLDQFKAPQNQNLAPTTNDFFAYLGQNDPAAIERLRKRFESSCLKEISLLRKAIGLEDTSEQRAIIHKLRGLANLQPDLGLPELLDAFNCDEDSESRLELCEKLVTAVTIPAAAQSAEPDDQN